MARLSSGNPIIAHHGRLCRGGEFCLAFTPSTSIRVHSCDDTFFIHVHEAFVPLTSSQEGLKQGSPLQTSPECRPELELQGWCAWERCRLRSRRLLAAPGPLTAASLCSSCSSSQASRPITNCGALAAILSGATYSPKGSSSFRASSYKAVASASTQMHRDEWAERGNPHVHPGYYQPASLMKRSLCRVLQKYWLLTARREAATAACQDTRCSPTTFPLICHLTFNWRALKHIGHSRLR